MDVDQDDSCWFRAETLLAGLCVKQKPATNQQAVPHIWTKALTCCQHFSKGLLQSFFTTTRKRSKNICECTTAELRLAGSVHMCAQKIRRPVCSAAWAWVHQRKDEKLILPPSAPASAFEPGAFHCCWAPLSWRAVMSTVGAAGDALDQDHTEVPQVSTEVPQHSCRTAEEPGPTTFPVPRCPLKPGGKRAVKRRESKRSV